MKRVRKVRTKTRRALYLVLLLLARPTEVTLSIGIPMVAFGQFINLTTYGILRKRDTLVTRGPYAWCRNPFYVGSLLSDFGFCVMSNPADYAVAIVTVAYAVVQGTFFYLQIRKEERLLLEIHGSEYKEYCEKVRWRLLPSIVCAIRNGGFRFQWSAKLAFYNRIFSRVTSAGFWICVFWAAKEVTGSSATRIIKINASWGVLLTHPYIIATAFAVGICYYVLRFFEKRAREKVKMDEAGEITLEVAASRQRSQKSQE